MPASGEEGQLTRALQPVSAIPHPLQVRDFSTKGCRAELQTALSCAAWASGCLPPAPPTSLPLTEALLCAEHTTGGWHIMNGRCKPRPQVCLWSRGRRRNTCSLRKQVKGGQTGVGGREESWVRRKRSSGCAVECPRPQSYTRKFTYSTNSVIFFTNKTISSHY